MSGPHEPPDDAMPADLAALLADLPQEIEPERDLWAGVHDAIAPVPRPAPEPHASRWGWAIAGIAAMVAVSVTSAWLTARSLRGEPPVQIHTVAVEVPSWERDIRQTTDDLQEVLTERRDQMDPEAVATVERALREIDSAILDIRGALAEDPDSEPLRGALANAYQHKVQVLRAVSELP